MMELHSLHAPSWTTLAHDALVLVGVGTALLAGLAFIALGLLLPGLLTARGGQFGDPGGRCLEFGEFAPAAGPILSEPVPSRVMDQETGPEPRHAARPHLWSNVSGNAVSHPAPLVLTVSR